MTELTELVLDFQKQEKSLDYVFRRIAPIVYNYPLRSKRGTEDECGEFLIFFYSRLLRLLKKYQYKPDSCFEAYLFLSMRYQYSSFYKRQIKKINGFENYDVEYTITENTYDNVYEKTEADVSNATYLIRNFNLLCTEKIRKKNVLQKRIMILALMNCETITESEASTCAHAIGIDYEAFQVMIDTLRLRINERDLRRQTLRKRRNAAMIHLRSIEHKLQSQWNNEDETYCLEQRMIYYRQLLQNCQLQLRKMRIKPMHSEIAEVTKLPEGTIHYTMSYFREMHKNLTTDALINLELEQNSMVAYLYDDSTCKQQQSQANRDSENKPGNDDPKSP